MTNVRTITLVASSPSALDTLKSRLESVLASHGKLTQLQDNAILAKFPASKAAFKFEANEASRGKPGHILPMLPEPDNISRGNPSALRTGDVGAWFSRMPTNPGFMVVHHLDASEPHVEVWNGISF